MRRLRHIWQTNRKIYGAPKLHFLLTQDSMFASFSLKRVQRLMRQMGIHSKAIKKWRATGQSVPTIERANLLQQDFSTTALNQKWSTDITYIHTKKDGWLYLSRVMDLHSRKIVAWDLGRHMTDALVVQTLKKSL